MRSKGKLASTLARKVKAKGDHIASGEGGRGRTREEPELTLGKSERIASMPREVSADLVIFAPVFHAIQRAIDWNDSHSLHIQTIYYVVANRLRSIERVMRRALCFPASRAALLSRLELCCGMLSQH